MMPGSKSEAEYQADSDARTLRDAMTVSKSPKRLKAAQGALKQLEKEAHQALMETRAAQGLKKSFPADKEGS